LDRALVETQLTEAGSFGVAVDAHAVQGRDRIGGRVLHPGGSVEQQHAVTDPRSLLGDDLLGRERELAVGDHAGEAVEDLDIDPFELARPPSDRRRRLPGQDPEERLPSAHRDALDPGPLAPARAAYLAVDDLAQPPGTRHQGPLGLVDDASDLVLAVEGLARRGPDLAQDHEPAVVSA